MRRPSARGSVSITITRILVGKRRRPLFTPTNAIHTNEHLHHNTPPSQTRRRLTHLIIKPTRPIQPLEKPAVHLPPIPLHVPDLEVGPEVAEVVGRAGVGGDEVEGVEGGGGGWE